MLEYEDLVAQFPDDVNCAFCGKPNDWDEEGFFYLWTEPGVTELEAGQAACKECREGEPGRIHEELHGPGDEGR